MSEGPDSGAPVPSFGAALVVARELESYDGERVFVARDVAAARDVIVTIPPVSRTAGASLERFLREIRIAAQLSDSHVAPVLSGGVTDNGALYYTSTFVQGELLQVRMARGPFTLSESINILRDVARALAHAHKHGVVHRELTPRHVILSFGSAVVTGFGVAKAIQAARMRTSDGIPQRLPLSRASAMYMAPEQVVGESVDARADLYAFGVMAYEMLMGQHPFAGKQSAEEFARAHAAEQPVHLLLKMPDTSSALTTLVMQCLEKDPALRPISASEIVHALEDTTVLTRPTPVAIAAVSGPTRTGWLARVALLALAVVVLFGLPQVAPLIQSFRFQSDSLRTSANMSSIAVMPFRNIGSDSSIAYLANGLGRELVAELEQLPNLRVASWDVSRRYAGSPAVLSATKVLAVDAILSGDVERSGAMMRVRAQLTSGLSGRVEWSGSYTVRAPDVIGLQDDLITSLFKIIAPSAGSRFSAEGARGTKNASAYDAYLHGLFASTAATATAEDWFRKSIAGDASFARAHAALARAILERHQRFGVPADSLLTDALAASRRAVQLAPSLAEAHDVLGRVLSALLDVRGAATSFARARQLDGTNMDIASDHALNLLALGQVREGAIEAQLLADSSGSSAQPLYPSLVSEYLLRHFDESVITASRILSADSLSVPALLLLGHAHLQKGQIDSAVAIGEQLMRKTTASPTTTPGVPALLVEAYAAARRWQDASRIRRMILASPALRGGYDAIAAHLAFGNHAAAIALLEAAEHRVSDIAWLSPSIGCDPLFDSIKDERGYVALLARRQLLSCAATTPWPVRSSAPNTDTPQANP